MIMNNNNNNLNSQKKGIKVVVKSKPVKQISKDVSGIINNKIIFKVPKKNSNSRFKDKSTNIEYVKTLGKWKCLKCSKNWFSAYTWLSLKFCSNNNDVDFIKTQKRKNKFLVNKDINEDNTILFNGKNLKKEEILMQFCKSCNNKNNMVVNYSNLEKSEIRDEKKPHIRNLCAKCLSGNLCSDDDSFI